MHQHPKLRLVLATLLFSLMTSTCSLAGDVTVTRCTYRDWPDAVHATNGEVELVIVPQIGGRIMRYAKVGGENVLWENATASLRDVWPNWGGDKVWIWPQDDWTAVQGTAWPPPAGADQGAYAVKINGGTITLTSPSVEGYDVRVERTIELATAGTRVTITNRLLPAEGHPSQRQIAAWTVTQVPKPAKVYARRSQSTLENGYRLMMRHMWPGVESTDELVTIPMLKTTTHKIGIDADALAAEIAGSVFVQELIGESTGAPPEPGDQAQVYSESDVLRDRDPSTGAYVELELTSPRATAARQPTLKVVWSLSDGEPAQALRSR